MKKLAHQIETVVKWVVDEDPDLSWLQGQDYRCKESCTVKHEHCDETQNEKQNVQDTERLAAYNRQEWWMEGCTVKAYLNGKEIGYAALWGIESDREAEYTKEIEADLTAEAVEDAETWLKKLA